MANKCICSKCGGGLHGAKCLLCEMFEAGLSQPLVEKDRQNNPKASMAMKVHPKQVREATEDAIRKGCPTEFNKDGCPLFTSRKHQARYIKLYGFRNNDASYGDE